MKRSPLRIFAAACIVVAGICLIVTIYLFCLDDKSVSQGDFICYWAAESQFLHSANPYDPAVMLRQERALGLDRDQPIMLYSPPVALLLAAPFGVLSAKNSLILWMLAMLGCLTASIGLLGLLFGRPVDRLYLLGCIFPPALACLSVGQIGIFLLLGLVLFLYLHHSRPWLAGAALLPCAMKPHLFLPLAIVLLLWVVTRKAYRILAGFALALAAACALPLAINPHIWSQYSRMMHDGLALNIYAPTLCSTFRLLVDRQAPWTQFLLEAAACCWAPWYFWSRRDCWRWMDQGMLLLLVSALCSPFGWITDEAILLPAVLAGLYRAAESRRSFLPLWLIAGAALIEVMAGTQITTPYYVWTTPAWLIWYLYATGKIGARSGQAHSDAAIRAKPQFPCP
jgi:hypothetical protein